MEPQRVTKGLCVSLRCWVVLRVADAALGIFILIGELSPKALLYERIGDFRGHAFNIIHHEWIKVPDAVRRIDRTGNLSQGRKSSSANCEFATRLFKSHKFSILLSLLPTENEPDKTYSRMQRRLYRIGNEIPRKGSSDSHNGTNSKVKLDS